MNTGTTTMIQARVRQEGVMLIEALIGILIFSIGILALIGMQATAMRATMDAKYRSEASFLANEIIGQMWVDRGAGGTNLANYAIAPSLMPADCSTPSSCAWFTRVATRLPNSTGANAPTISVSGREVTVIVRWQRPGESTVSNHTTVAQIND
jgi:type IV pilus assembly protein PilV